MCINDRPGQQPDSQPDSQPDQSTDWPARTSPQLPFLPAKEPAKELAQEPAKKQPLSNKVALVTSSAPGLCVQTAKQLAQAGARVIVCGRDAHQGLSTIKEIRKSGGRATFVLADIAITADVQSVIDETIATYGRLDILFNNVSNSYARDSLLMDVSELVWDRLIDPLLKGTFFCCQYALPVLQQSGGGTIINLIEQTPESPNDSVSMICQGGAMALTSAIAHQFAASPVTTNLIWVSPTSAAPMPLSLLSPQVITSLPAESRPFNSAAEAILYLAHNGTAPVEDISSECDRIDGATLVVSP